MRIRLFLLSLFAPLVLACASDAAGPTSEAWPGLCTDGIDNDGDGAVDCGDPDCAAIPAFCGGGDVVGGDTWTAADTAPSPADTFAPADTVVAADTRDTSAPPIDPAACLPAGAGCDQCPAGWDRCLEVSGGRNVCSKVCDSDGDCGECGACVELTDGPRCVNWDAYAAGLCPSGWTCMPQFQGCTAIGTTWSGDGLQGVFDESESYTRNILDLSFGDDYPGVGLRIQTYDFDGGLPTLGTWNLRAGIDGNYATCTHCVSAVDGCTDQACARWFFQGWGVGRFDSVATEGGQAFAGQLADLILVETELDPEDAWSTPVPTGACYRIESLTWNGAARSSSSGPPNLSASGGGATAGD